MRMFRAFFRWLLTDPERARAARRPSPPPSPAPAYREYDDSEDWGINSIFGMG